MDPTPGPTLTQIKGCFLPCETVGAARSPVSESHPIMDRSCGLRDLVPAVDHLATGEALELELALTAHMTFHSPLGRSGGLESKFTGGVFAGVHCCRLVLVSSVSM